MHYFPLCKMWCWILNGEDAMFFSHPTRVYLCEPPRLAADGRVLAVGALETRWLDAWAACVARCQYQTRYCLDDEPLHLGTGTGLTPPIQCGVVASVDPLGRYFCDYHRQCQWECYECHTPLAHGAGGFCSQACREACDALDSED